MLSWLHFKFLITLIFIFYLSFISVNTFFLIVLVIVNDSTDTNLYKHLLPSGFATDWKDWIVIFLFRSNLHRPTFSNRWIESIVFRLTPYDSSSYIVCMGLLKRCCSYFWAQRGFTWSLSVSSFLPWKALAITAQRWTCSVSLQLRSVIALVSRRAFVWQKK